MLSFILFAGFVSAETPAEPKHSAFRSVPFTNVHFADSFWSPRLETNRTVSIPHNYKWCEDTGRFTNFAKAAKLMDGKFEGIYYNDAGVYKVLEGTAYSLAQHPDPELEKRADAVIAWITAAQQPNGYIYTFHTLNEPHKRWTEIGKHELYCAGHLIESAVAYKQATGKDTLLNVAEKAADHIIDVFITNQTAKFEVPGHEEIELALVKLYQQTGKEKYLKLAEHFLDIRGDKSKRTDKLAGARSQDHLPVREQKEIVGHAVKAMYLCAGVADIAAYTGDEGLIAAMDSQWNDTVKRKMYITGGIGARHEGETFGNAYELPNRTAYCETCAAIGLVFWAHRMNLLTGDAKYADIVERLIYNGILSGIGLDGRSFFYVNPLEADAEQTTRHDVVKNAEHHRQPFFVTACCPANVIRFLPSLPGYQYAVDKDNTLVINQYFTGKAKIGNSEVDMQTDSPWNGKVRVNICGGDLSQKSLTIKYRAGAKYETKNITPGQAFEIHLPCETKRIIAHPQVKNDNGRVAIQRGPIVYCFEECDNPRQKINAAVTEIKLAKDPQFRTEFKKDLLGGVTVIKCRDVAGKELTAVPYYVWDNRTMGAMTVWVRQDGLDEKRPPDTGELLYKEF
ncbi:MAG: glycoside hydrolase family 127 protein [Planctomycetaceae bacterium]|nr:glycoside hydrolase family 127 protein [Planctomycetaceae bacterium]